MKSLVAHVGHRLPTAGRETMRESSLFEPRREWISRREVRAESGAVQGALLRDERDGQSDAVADPQNHGFVRDEASGRD